MFSIKKMLLSVMLIVPTTITFGQTPQLAKSWTGLYNNEQKISLFFKQNSGQLTGYSLLNGKTTNFLGTVKDGQINLEEIYRFDNGQIRKNGHDCWDLEKLVASVKAGIDEAISKYEIESIGIDTWGVDYILLDSNDNEIYPCYCYRDQRTKKVIDEVHEKICRQEHRS